MPPHPARCRSGCSPRRSGEWRSEGRAATGPRIGPNAAGGAGPAKGRSQQAWAQSLPVLVLPRAGTGTVVSSPCRRSAAMTWPSISACSGASAAAAAACLVRQGREAELHSLPRVPLGLPVERLMLAARHRPRTDGGRWLAVLAQLHDPPRARPEPQAAQAQGAATTTRSRGPDAPGTACARDGGGERRVRAASPPGPARRRDRPRSPPPRSPRAGARAGRAGARGARTAARRARA